MNVELSSLFGVMNVIQEYDLKISEFEDLLQRITADMASGAISERTVPSEAWKRTQRDIAIFRNLAKQIGNFMLILKPERAPTIKRHIVALTKPLSAFENILQKPEVSPEDSRIALEELRKATTEGSNILELAKEIRDNPSESISTILKLKEIYDAKEYLSAISIPEAAYVRFEGLKKEIKALRLSILNLERSLTNLKNSLDAVSAEVSKFRPLSEEKTQKEQGNSSQPSGRNKEED